MKEKSRCAMSMTPPASSSNEIQALVVVLFPECTQVFADPCLPTALMVLKTFPSAQDVAEAISRFILGTR